MRATTGFTSLSFLYSPSLQELCVKIKGYEMIILSQNCDGVVILLWNIPHGAAQTTSVGTQLCQSKSHKRENLANQSMIVFDKAQGLSFPF